jgi:hypothetical protein
MQKTEKNENKSKGNTMFNCTYTQREGIVIVELTAQAECAYVAFAAMDDKGRLTFAKSMGEIFHNFLNCIVASVTWEDCGDDDCHYWFGKFTLSNGQTISASGYSKDTALERALAVYAGMPNVKNAGMKA